MTGLNSDGAIKTPHLDKMAQAGIHFSQFYAAYPNCAPTRASLLTGRHPLRMGINSIGKKLPTEEVTIAHVLSQAGYRTGQFGKWHLQGQQEIKKATTCRSLEEEHNSGYTEQLNPGTHGFTHWSASPNYYDLDPSFIHHDGTATTYEGDSSDV